MAKIKVDGVDYKVKENLGFQPSAGVYVKVVETEDGERTVVRHRAGAWRWWKAIDRITPLYTDSN